MLIWNLLESYLLMAMVVETPQPQATLKYCVANEEISLDLKFVKKSPFS